MRQYLVVTVLAALANIAAHAQGPTNLIVNPAAEYGVDGWHSAGEAAVEEFAGNRCFAVRNGGRLQQTVVLPEGATGKFVLFIAHVSSERTASDITDRAYLYGLTGNADLGRIVLYNQAASMVGQGERPNQWTKAWGIFALPEGASTISYQLSQGRRRGIPHTGAAARFDDVGLFVFDSRYEAESFVLRYR